MLPTLLSYRFPADGLIVVRTDNNMVELEIDNHDGVQLRVQLNQHTAAALCVAVCMAGPVLVKSLLAGVVVTGLYAVATYPRTAVQP